MHCYVERAVKASRGFAASLVIAMMMLASSPVGATSNLQAVICRDTPATLTITHPESDSVISTSDVQLSGDVTQSGQLEFYVDDAYNSVEPIPYGGNTYTTTIHLTPGTHTIKVIAIDTCQIQDAVATVVLTYQPVSIPSVGGKVATNVDGAVTGTEQVTPQKSIFQSLFLEPLTLAGEGLDLITHDVTGTKTSFANSARFGAIIIGILMIAFARPINGAVMSLLGQLHLNSVYIGKFRLNGRKVIIGIGSIIIILVFMV